MNFTGKKNPKNYHLISSMLAIRWALWCSCGGYIHRYTIHTIYSSLRKSKSRCVLVFHKIALIESPTEIPLPLPDAIHFLLYFQVFVFSMTQGGVSGRWKGGFPRTVSSTEIINNREPGSGTRVSRAWLARIEKGGLTWKSSWHSCSFSGLTIKIRTCGILGRIPALMIRRYQKGNNTTPNHVRKWPFATANYFV